MQRVLKGAYSVFAKASTYAAPVRLWLYPGNGKATGGIFGTRVAFGTGWQSYNLFG